MKYNAIISSIREKLRYLTSVKSDSDHKISNVSVLLDGRFETLGGQEECANEKSGSYPKDTLLTVRS
jgi:hypothetical protein